MKKSILLLAAIVAVGCGGPSGPGVDTPIVLKLAPKEGESYSYTIETDNGTTPASMDVTVHIEKVEPNKIKTVAQLNSMLSDGKEPPSEVYIPMKRMRIYNEMDPTGKILSSYTTEGPDSATSVGANAVSFPTTPVKVGDIWEGTTHTFGKKGVHAKYRLATIEEVNGKRLARIEVTPDGQAGATLEGPIVTQVEVSNGMLYSMSMKSIIRNPQGDVTTSVEMKRK